jgi:cytidine deaminase
VSGVDSLISLAIAAKARALCPYSRFPVGAAIEAKGGIRHTGANVENASYTLGLCAERVAIFHALTHGVEPGTIERIVIATDAANPTPPCGACLQILSEFALDATVTLVAKDGSRSDHTVRALLPLRFTLDPG